MFATTDTIVAIATPPGPGGIGVVRLSGPDAHEIARLVTTHRGPFEARRATLTRAIGGPRAGAVSQPEALPDTEDGAPDGRPGQTPSAIDRVVVTYFPAPASYTGDDVVEISAHGSPIVLAEIVGAALARGARGAVRGEFTLRAFLNGRVDLPQAEAVVDLIEAATPLQAETAFDQLNGTLTGAIAAIESSLFDLIARLEASVDFPDEGYHFLSPSVLAEELDALIAQTGRLLAGARHGRLLREGVQIAIIGPPNVGKSSVFNALVGAARAIVADKPGTTRDLVTETLDLGGLRATLVDTAGLRSSDDIVESEGVRRAEEAARVADLVLMIADRSRPLSGGAWAMAVNDVPRGPVLKVANKCDLPSAWTREEREDVIEISARNLAGLEVLRRRITAALDFEVRERPGITNIRHIALVERADAAFRRARAGAGGHGAAADEARGAEVTVNEVGARETGAGVAGARAVGDEVAIGAARFGGAAACLSEEFVLADLQEARDALAEVVGRRAPEEVLERIFERFCIGK